MIFASEIDAAGVIVGCVILLYAGVMFLFARGYNK